MAADPYLLPALGYHFVRHGQLDQMGTLVLDRHVSDLGHAGGGRQPRQQRRQRAVGLRYRVLATAVGIGRCIKTSAEVSYGVDSIGRTAGDCPASWHGVLATAGGMCEQGQESHEAIASSRAAIAAPLLNNSAKWK